MSNHKKKKVNVHKSNDPQTKEEHIKDTNKGALIKRSQGGRK